MKLLLGGSPCTHWSIAQTKNRETQPEGIGWELFKNYLIALRKFKPDYFLYENNKSMSAAIRKQITKEFCIEPICINSALVSAQNRQRLYWVGRRNPDGTYSQVPVEQPKDKGILLRYILESGVSSQEKSYCLTTTEFKESSIEHTLKKPVRTQVVEPIRIGTIENNAKKSGWDSKEYRVYSSDGKSTTLCRQGGGAGAKTGLYAVPCDCDVIITDSSIRCQRRDKKHSTVQGSYVNLKNGKSQTLSPSHVPRVIEENDEIPGNEMWNNVYEVRNGQISIKEKQYLIKLADGNYIIRKLTVTECKRLQTVPDDYVFPVSNSQAYKMLGNGWTVDVIAHILSYCPQITSDPLNVLSMYDGMSCGRLALQKLRGKVDTYFATETDKYAIKTTQYNFPDTIQLGDAFQVRDNDWEVPQLHKGGQRCQDRANVLSQVKKELLTHL